ncbi:MAG TPA: SAM-dependent methyltransferase [Pseudonocardiaceae bacterium]|nr:SAM-dependent methyltransferase [Pseudonocardiaceae bacterium]
MNEVWVPEYIDVHTASVARMYDYYLGGGHNLEADRAAARAVIEVMPLMVPTARANRAFLQRAVRACLDQGVRQFLDLGSGIPTVGHVHEIAHAVDPNAKVAYVDTDPIAVAHTELLLANVPAASITRADMTNPAQVLSAPGVADLLDFDRPVAVIVAAVLHFVANERNPKAILNTYRDAAAPGSLLVFSHGAVSDLVEGTEVGELYQRTSHPLVGRTETEIAELLQGWQLLEPGLVEANDWRPEDLAEPPLQRTPMLAAVASRP